MLAESLTALQELAPIAALRSGRWSYAAVNAAHIVGFALLFGAIVPLDLRLMGWRRRLPIAVLARLLLPLAAAGLALAIAAGFVLFSTRAVEYAALSLFRVKLALVACGVLNAILLHRAAQWESAQDVGGAMPPPRVRAAGALSLALWLSTIVCGRMLAFVG